MHTIIHPDYDRGFDVMSGTTVVASYPTKEEAQVKAREHKRYYIRYWEKKNQ